MWLCGDLRAPRFVTVENFINNDLKATLEKIQSEINTYIFERENVDLEHVYIDGTKITANANKYSWVWKKSCVKSRQKTFEKINALIE